VRYIRLCAVRLEMVESVSSSCSSSPSSSSACSDLDEFTDEDVFDSDAEDVLVTDLSRTPTTQSLAFHVVS